ncbi:MAG: glycine--tRNA ligase, partial [Candidatus Thermoplasmatota archaeon]|nr:glycine--tRNA ligase [Candidatus Thermoplasmatota archaeon]
MFTNFDTIYRHFRQRLPFGAVQIGKGYRNEISPRQGMIRQREFNMAELEYFIDPDAPVDLTTVIRSSDEINLIPDPEGQIESVSEMTIASALEKSIIRHPIVGKFMLETYELLIMLGIDPQRIRFRQHEQDEMAHYASDCWDCEIHGSYGWIECVGIAHRGCYDLDAHSRSTSSSDLKA